MSSGTSLHAVLGKKLSETVQNPSQAVINVTQMLDVMDSWINEIPPEQRSLRFGNPAFRTWYSRLAEQADQLLRDHLPPELHPAIIELSGYLKDSFGNATRIDYGTGHETTFCAFLYCLKKLGLFKDEDHASVVGVIFNRYLGLTRRLQTTYW
jgi:serine/threonine-protein phosphatase 2A activator